MLCFFLTLTSYVPGRQIELTNQDGEAMAIPAEDSAALMEGMMLHRQGLACVARAGAGAGAASASAATVAAARGGETRNAQKKKARHPPLPPQGGNTPSVGETPATTPTPTPTPTTATTTAITATTSSDSVGKYAEGNLDDGTDKEALECSGGGTSDREEGRTQGVPEEKGEERVAEQGDDMQVADDAQDLGATSKGGAEGGGGDAAMSNAGAGIADDDASATFGGRGGSKGAAKSVAKGKGRAKPGERSRLISILLVV